MKKIKILLLSCLILIAALQPTCSQGIQIRKIAYNPNAADYSGLGYGDIPAYVPPLDPAPGLVQVGPDLLPNFQITDPDFSGTCVPGDTIIFYIEVYNGSGAPIPVLVEDDIPAGMTNAQAPHVPPPPLVPLPAGTVVNIADTSGDAIIGNGGDTVQWNIPALPPGYTLLTYQADVLADGTVTFGGRITNSSATVYYYEGSILRSLTAPSITLLVQAAQLIKEAFQDLACAVPASTILPGSRLYYRLTVYNTVSPLSPLPYNATITDITDTIPAIVTGPQYEAFPPGLAPQPIVANTISWQGLNLLGPGLSINGIYSVLVPIGAAGRIINNAQLTYNVSFPPPGGATVSTTSNSCETRIGTIAFDDMATLFSTNTFLVAGDQAYCTDVLGSAKISYGLAKGGVTDNPEGRTDLTLTTTEHDTGNLIPVGGPAINSLADEFDGYFSITYNYNPGGAPPVFEITADGYTITLNLNDYPNEDICIVYLAEHNGRNVMLVWGYGWQGTYAGSMYIGDTATWTTWSGYRMLMLRWTDSNVDGLVQMEEITVEYSS